MKINTNTTPSSQIDSFIPNYVYRNYSNFVDFMQKSSESEERIGFGQDILQNLQKYRDFDYYNDKIIQFDVLNVNITETSDELTLTNSFGFPDSNGVILIDDEVILYRTRNGNTLEGLQRGAAGTTVLPTLRSSNTYVKTTAASHNKGSEVQNLSVMFLVAMLDNIHQSFTPNISSSRVSSEVNRSSLLQNIRDFFSSKGSALGIKALFKMLFDQNDVEVSYPGDRMIKPSDSTWTETLILRTVPMSEPLTDPTKKYVTPEKLLGTNLKLKDYRDGSVLATVYSDYISTYPFESTIQYEFSLDKGSVDGTIIANPSTTLTRELKRIGGSDDRFDVTTITVESTVGFPDTGIVFIDDEGINYTSKTFNQFLGCTRGAVSVEDIHNKGADVYGPYYIQTESTDINGLTRASFSFPIGLVSKVDVIDGGKLQLLTDSITPGEPGKVDPGNEVINSFIENYDDDLVTQQVGPPTLGYVSNFSQGVSGVYFDDEYTYVPSTNLPGYPLEPFGPYSGKAKKLINTETSASEISTESDFDITTEGDPVLPVGELLVGENAVHVIPNRETIKQNTENTRKGTDIVGVAVDGVPFYSNNSKDKQVFGKVLRFNVISGGFGYVNPNVIMSGGTQGKVTLSDTSVTAVDVIVSGEYSTQPEVIVADGIGAKVDLTFDNYGRILTATVTNGGQYYNSPPSIVVYDSSNRGLGARLTSTISVGELTDVEIKNSGIDYNPATTTAEVVSIGTGAVVEAVCESYTFDEYQRIRLNSLTDLDSNNAYLFKDENGNNSKFAYLANPVSLRKSLGDTGATHSPIIGWAVDGNPIYGPYLYTNGTDSSGGVQQAAAGYYLPADRSNTIPLNSTVVSNNPPPTSLFPMGTFIEDYVFDPVQAAIRGGRILTDPERDFLQAENDDFIKYSEETAGILGKFNGKVCNTPEFPADLYPDGVFIYIATTFGDVGQFPYTVGPVYRNRPQSQNVRLLNNGVEIKTDKPESSYDNTVIDVDFTSSDRLRSPYLSSTKEELDVQITPSSGILSGSIDTITAEDGTIAEIAVDDLLYFDNSGTGGSGAMAKVTHVSTTSGTIIPSDPQSATAGGFEIVTKLYSHKQRINLNDATPTTPSYTFPITYKFVTDGGASAVVDAYDPISKTLEVTITSWRLIKYGDTFKDAKGRDITLPTNPVANETVFGSDTVGGTSTHMAFSDPSTRDHSAEPGDLWWSGDNGRLYIYYNDGNSSQWVSAFPLGMRSFSTSGDVPSGPTSTSGGVVSQPHSGNTVAISENAPSRRTDGSANVRGDLWWSTHTGMLYIYSSDNPSLGGNSGEYEWSSEWIATDPTAMVSMEGASNDYEYSTISAGSGPDYEDNVRVVISDTSPTTLPGGGAITMGTLWWSPINGKMYIYYTDSDSSQWIITNPSGTLSNQSSLDKLVVGDGSGLIDTLGILPEPADNDILWLESMDNIFVGDILQTSVGAPGFDEVDSFTVLEIRSEHEIKVLRDSTPIAIPHGALITNLSRYIYRIVTDGKNGLQPGVEIIIDSPVNPTMDGTYNVQTVGDVTVPTASADISGGSVTGVNIITSGANYKEGFYVYFVGGGGVGAYGYANVSALDDGGGVTSVDILEGGVNYSSNPAVIFDATDSDESFTIFTDQLYQPDANLTFDTTDKLIQYYTTTKATKLELISGGVDYLSLPLVIGSIHKSTDRVETEISLDGSTIGSVEVISGGNRYSAPIARFTDTTGSGSGAAADVTVVDGAITAITMTNNGTGYLEPVLDLVEPGGVFSMTTKDIGRITSVYINNPGRNISTERSLAPELVLDIRLVFTRVDGYSHLFNINDEIYQGSPSKKTATARIVEYDTQRQILKLDTVSGKFSENEMIYGPGATTGGLVTLCSGADLKISVSGSKEIDGRFITDKSQVSESSPVIQDSYRYQNFSYNIASPLQQVQYDSFIQDIIHPAGFIRFSTLTINDSIECNFTTSEPTIVLQGDLSTRAFGSTPILLRAELPYVITTEKDEIIAGEQFP